MPEAAPPPAGSDAATEHKRIRMRRATGEDVHEIYEMLQWYFREGELPYPQPIDLFAISWILNIIAQGNVIVAECAGKIIGSIAFEVSAFPWNPQVRHIHGHWVFVDPEFRQGGTGINLLKTAKQIADQNDMNLLLGAIWGVEPEKMSRLFRSLGFRLVGSAYLYSPSWEKAA